MKPDVIKQHIDNNITKMLERDSYDEVRDKILKIVNNFRERITGIELEYKNIESLNDSRSRYTAFYVYFAEKRIIDLYKLERKIVDKSPLKAYKTLLFKERLDRRENLPFTYSPKYKKFIKYDSI
jgi:hypothetical protein